MVAIAKDWSVPRWDYRPATGTGVAGTLSDTVMRPSEVQKDAWREFLIAHARVTRELDKRLVKSGQVSLDIYDVLVTLEFESTGKLRMSELADKIVFSRSGLTRFIDRLVTSGYVKREPCLDDRRGAYAVLTEKGRQARLNAWVVFEPTIYELWCTFVDEDRAADLTKLFKKMTKKSNGRL